MPIRWIAHTRVSMQRLGTLLAVATSASEHRVTSSPILGQHSYALLKRPIELPPGRADAFRAYLRDMRLWERYGRGDAAGSFSAGAIVAAQDIWLADGRLPSATGAITEDVTDDPVSWASDILLVRPKNHTLTDRGKALRLAAPQSVAALIGGEIDPNPFELPGTARLLLAYALIEADGDLIAPAYEAASATFESTFTRADFARPLAAACREVVTRWSRRTRTGEDRAALTRLTALESDLLKERGSGKNWGGGRPPDQAATVRLEPYVDLGLVDKTERTSYVYRLRDEQREFWRELYGRGAEGFLTDGLVTAWLRATGQRQERADDESVWNAIVASYPLLRSPLGYASLNEVLILAIGREITSSGRYFEINDGLAVVRRRYRDNPGTVRFGIRRGGGLGYLKLVGGEK